MSLNQGSRASAVAIGFDKLANPNTINLRPEIVLMVAQVGDDVSASASNLTLKQVFSTDNYKAVYGYGSPLSIALDRYFAVGASPVLYVLPVKSGISASKSSTNVEITGLKATKAFTSVLKLGSTVIQTGVSKGTLLADVYESIAAAVNKMSDAPALAELTTTGTQAASGTFTTSSLSSSLTALKAVNRGTITLNIGGQLMDIPNINLTKASTLSDVASILSNLLTVSNVKVTLSNDKLVFTNNEKGVGSTIDVSQTKGLATDVTTSSMLDASSGTGTQNTFTIAGVAAGKITALKAVSNGALGVSYNGVAQTLTGIDFSSVTDLASLATLLTREFSTLTAPIVVTVENTTDLKFTAGTDTTKALLIQAPALPQDLSLAQYFNVASGVKQAGTDDTRQNSLTLKSKWSGADANNIYVSLTDDNGSPITAEQYGVSASVSRFDNGAGVPSLGSYLSGLSSTIEFTRVANQWSDDANLDAIMNEFAERRNVLTSQYALSYYTKYNHNADLETNFAELKQKGASRIQDSINVCLPLNTCELDIEATAEFVGRISTSYAGNVGKPIRNIALATLHPRMNNGFSYEERDTLLKEGVSNVLLRQDGYIVQDVVCHYHPLSDNIMQANPTIFAFDEDVTALGNIAYDARQKFEYSDRWLSVKFIEDKDVSSNVAVRKLSDVKADLNASIDLWVDNAIMRDSEFAKANSTVEFNKSNPERVDMDIRGKLPRVGRIFNLNVLLRKS